MAFGKGEYTYELSGGWGTLPDGMEFKQVAGVAVDKDDNVYVYNRVTHNLVIFNREGQFLDSWDLQHKEPHNVSIDENGNIFLVDRNSHVVLKYNQNRELILTLGSRDKPSDTGEQSQRFLVERPGIPFNMPTDLAISSTGDLYISDGYSNCRVHKYTSTGSLVLSWGEPGKNNPGDFHLPHGIGIDLDGRIIVCDRENNRIQLFDENGEFLGIWTGFLQPTAVATGPDGEIYVSELQHRVSIVEAATGNILAQIGGQSTHEPGGFVAPHGIAVDSHGDIYVGEVLEGQRIQKFVRGK